MWAGAAITVLVASILAGRLLMARTASLTGTNSVDVATLIINAEPGQRLCVNDVIVPRGTGRVGVSMVALQAGRRPRVEAWIKSGSSTIHLDPMSAPGALAFLDLELPEPTRRDLDGAAVCVVPRDVRLGYGGASVQRLPGSRSTTLGGQSIEPPGDVGVQFLRPDGDSPRVVEALPAALARATIFESSTGTVIVWLALPLLGLSLYIVVRIAATAGHYTIRKLALAIAALAFAHGACWAVLMHPFHGADESEHFAYAQHLAATNERPDPATKSARSAYSSSQLRLMEALHHNSTILNTTSRPRWENGWNERYKRAASGSSDVDGGGGSESATGHSPLYYAVIGLPYRALRGVLDLPSLLLVMRLFNALLASSVPALAVLTAARIFGPDRRAAAWTAGVLVAMQPVFGSVAGAVNNDTAVNAAAAVFVFLLVRAWDSGPTLRSAPIVGVVAIVLPLTKITGFALLPLFGVAAVVIAVRHGPPVTARWLAVASAFAAVTALAWVFAGPVFGGGPLTLYNVHSTDGPRPSPPRAARAAPALNHRAAPLTLVERGEYFAQTFIPIPLFGRQLWQLPGTSAIERWPAFYIYVDRGYGLFGWKSVKLGPDLLRGIAAGLAVGWLLALFAAFKRRREWRAWSGGVVVLGAGLLCVLTFISYAYASAEVRTDAGEQGRYAFTALVPLSVLFSGSIFAFRGRWRNAALGVLTSSAGALAVLAWLSALRGWFI